MTRKQFIERIARPSEFVMCNLAHNSVPSETDPSFALTGMQIFQASLRGQEIPQPAMLHYSMNGVTVDNLTPIDNPNVDYFDGVRYAKETKQDFTDKYKALPKEVLESKEES